jgi:hypothetical protein
MPLSIFTATLSIGERENPKTLRKQEIRVILKVSLFITQDTIPWSFVIMVQTFRFHKNK